MDIEIQSLKNWVLSFDDKSTKELLKLINEEETLNDVDSLFVNRYVELLNPYVKHLDLKNPNFLSSGLVFYFTSIYYISHFSEWLEKVRDVFLVTMLYLFVDHYLDDKNLDPKIRKEAITQLIMLSQNPELKLNFVDEKFESIVSIYKELNQRNPQFKKYLLVAFMSEVESVKIQQSPDHSYETYLRICYEKGGTSASLIQCLLDPEDQKLMDECYNLGKIIQLLDDCADCDNDNENKINTVATFVLKNEGCLDSLWKSIIPMISEIDERLYRFKYLFGFICAYTVGRYSHNFSKELNEQMKHLKLFEFLYKYDAENKLNKLIREEIEFSKMMEDLKI